MVGEAGTGLNAPAANSLRYATRQPDTDPQTLSLYGQSYSRSLLLAVGPFPPGLRVAEDSALNRQVARLVTPVWAPEVQTRYRDVATLQDWVRDERLYGLRRATHALYRPLATTETPAEGVANLLVLRLGFAKALQACDGSLPNAVPLPQASGLPCRLTGMESCPGLQPFQDKGAGPQSGWDRRSRLGARGRNA